MPYRFHQTAPLLLWCTLGLPAGVAAAVQSDTAFVLARAGIVPENIVYDAPRNRFLGGNLEEDGMIELHHDGSIQSFAEAAHVDGRVLGLKIDARRNLLWGVAFTRLPAPAGDTMHAPARSVVFALDLPGGRLVRRVSSPQDGGSHLFNDLVLGRDGTVYFTDSEAGAAWALAPRASELRLLHRAPPERFAYPNGIAFLPNERGLLVAHWQGLVTIELPSGRVREVVQRTILRWAGSTGCTPPAPATSAFRIWRTPRESLPFAWKADPPPLCAIWSAAAQISRAPPPAPSYGTRSTMWLMRRSAHSILVSRAALSRLFWYLNCRSGAGGSDRQPRRWGYSVIPGYRSLPICSARSRAMSWSSMCSGWRVPESLRPARTALMPSMARRSFRRSTRTGA